jgi:hypothetical protein
MRDHKRNREVILLNSAMSTLLQRLLLRWVLATSCCQHFAFSSYFQKEAYKISLLSVYAYVFVCLSVCVSLSALVEPHNFLVLSDHLAVYLCISHKFFVFCGVRVVSRSFMISL